jgi:CheY-like chemotaxis protein
MKPSALLVSRDRAALLLLQTTLDVLQIDSQVCYSAEEAIDAAVHGDYSALLLDCDVPQVAQVARMAHIAAGARQPLVGAMMGFSSPVSGTFQAGLNFVLHKPLSVEEVVRCLNLCKKSMRANRRGAPRSRLDTLVHLEIGGRALPALARDISEHGVALQAPEALPCGPNVGLRLILPGTHHKVEAACEVIWAEPDGRAGVFFTELTPQSRKHLKAWLAQHGPNRENAVRVLLPPLQRLVAKAAGR